MRLAYYEREHRDLVRLRYVEPVRSPMSARDGERLGYVEYFAENPRRVRAGSGAERAAVRLGSAVGALLAGEIPIARLARYFEYWVLRLQGLSLAERLRALRPPPRSRRPYRRGGRRLPVRRVRRRTGASRCRPRRCGFSATPPRPRRTRWRRSGCRRAADQELDRAHERLLAMHLEKELRAAKVLRAMARTSPRSDAIMMEDT